MVGGVCTMERSRQTKTNNARPDATTIKLLFLRPVDLYFFLIVIQSNFITEDL